jgi:hypothetical protein
MWSELSQQPLECTVLRIRSSSDTRTPSGTSSSPTSFSASAARGAAKTKARSPVEPYPPKIRRKLRLRPQKFDARVLTAWLTISAEAAGRLDHCRSGISARFFPSTTATP